MPDGCLLPLGLAVGSGTIAFSSASVQCHTGDASCTYQHT
jgi:hypothetical protein